MDQRIEEIKGLLPRGMLADWVRLGSRLVRLLRDRRHSDLHDAVLNRLLERAQASVARREQRRSNVPRVSYPPDLPITARKDDIVAAIRAHQVVVIAGETGSGKTTQIPKMCLEAGLGIEAQIGCTQPRRVAALSISRRIAEELNVAHGIEVGCKIRFEDRSGPRTYIKLMTDGILLAETQGDPLLAEYNAIIIDEAHERSLNIDLLLGHLKGLIAKRPDLKLVITSATIDTEAFSRAFNDAPIIEVSGRLYPVEVAYSPLDAASEESGDMTYIDAAVRAVERVICEPGRGDVLVFMPGERDIREASDLLEGRFQNDAEIIPLFGRLSSGEQQRVFAPASRRKIIIATNIAETSLTIPGIRYVIDSGLARVSRYNPRTRIERLPVESVSQSSANQRKGRAGRVQSGLCIRLYSEEDFAARPPYTQPEIQRANLAEVILRMKAFRLGEIETFPFINPPLPAAIQGGYTLLQELGALNEQRELTPLGCDLARLPIDPTLGRMLIQSRHEHATREILIIAAGLGMQDPRERPLDQKEAATAAHKRFLAPNSDFLAWLNIWDEVHDQWETLRTQNQRRKFCKAHFLSYVRMREWQDLHAQLHDALAELSDVQLNETNASYDAIHRSILTGLLGHVARKKERNTYEGASKRELAIFLGSVLHERGEPPKHLAGSRGKAPSKKAGAGQPEWIMAGETVETSQLFARTVAGINPEWIVELAPHLCKTAHSNPHWSAASGRVLVHEKITLYGLEVHNRTAAYGNIHPKEATKIFIRSALVEVNLFPAPPRPRREEDASKPSSTEMLLASAAEEGPTRRPVYRFMEHNHQTRQKIETWQTRVRRHDFRGIDEALFEFYSARLDNVSSLHELNRLLRDQTDPSFLCAEATDLIGCQELNYDTQAFPDALILDGESVPVSYSYAPGEEQDGVTIKLGFTLAESVSPALLEWAVPGLREAQITELLRALPKSIRRELMPFPPKVAEIVRDLRPVGPSLAHELARFIHQRYGIAVPASALSPEVLPPHLRPRVEIAGPNQKQVAAGRDLGQLRQGLKTVKVEPAKENPAWAAAARKWERFGLTVWNFGDIPDRVVWGEPGAAPLEAWPGLQLQEDHVCLRLFRSPEPARRATAVAVPRLIELAIQKDFGWLQKDLRALWKLAVANFISAEDLQSQGLENLKRHILNIEPFSALVETHFNAAVSQARERLAGTASQLVERVAAILNLRQEVIRRLGPSPLPAVVRPRTLSDLGQLGVAPVVTGPAMMMRKELDTLLPGNFLEIISFERLPNLPRYLKALLLRAERAAMNPTKDQDRARQLAPYLEKLRLSRSKPPESMAARDQIEEFRWMIEEFKVSLFAQELGTAMPVSPKRLDQQFEQLQIEAGV